MDKELEELIEKLKDVMENGIDNSKNIEKAKKTIIKKLEGNPECLIFATPQGHLSTGTAPQILSLVALIIHQLKSTQGIEIDNLIYSCLAGLALEEPEENATFDKDIVNSILEILKANM